MSPPRVFLAAALILLMCGCASPPRSHTSTSETQHRFDMGADVHISQAKQECLRSIKKARSDARMGKYRLFVENSGQFDEGFARFLRERMMSQYGIELVIYPSDSTDRDKCYSNEMDKIIYENFGAGILADIEQEARVLYQRQ